MNKYFHDQKVKGLIAFVRDLMRLLKIKINLGTPTFSDIAVINLMDKIKAQIREIENERN